MSFIKKMDLKVESILGFEIFFDNIPALRKKVRETKPQLIISDYQKVVRDFAFVIEEKYSSGEIIKLVQGIDKELIKTAEGPTYIQVRTRIALCILAVTGIRINELLPLKVYQLRTLIEENWIAIDRFKHRLSNHKIFLTKERKKII